LHVVKKIKNSGILYILPMLIFLMSTTFVPIVYVFVTGFYRNYLSENSAKFILFQNYIESFKDFIFLKSIFNTFYYVFFSVVFHIVVALLLAVFLFRNSGPLQSYAKGLRSLFMVPWLLSWSVAAAIWVLILNPSGLLSGAAITMGLIKEQIPWFGRPEMAMNWIIFITVWKAFPFFMMFIYAALTTIPVEIYESSEIDGATGIQKFSYITIPYIAPTLMTLTVLDSVWSLRMYDIIFLTTGGGPIHATQTLTLSIYQTAFERLNFGLASAQGVILFAISSLIALLYVKIYNDVER